MVMVVVVVVVAVGGPSSPLTEAVRSVAAVSTRPSCERMYCDVVLRTWFVCNNFFKSAFAWPGAFLPPKVSRHVETVI